MIEMWKVTWVKNEYGLLVFKNLGTKVNRNIFFL